VNANITATAMTGPFDILTIACFLLMVIAFFVWTERDTNTLLHLLISAVMFAVANQLGNHGSPILALILTAAGAGYALLIFLGGKPGGSGKR
jgi:hypothetical protein